MLYTSNKTYNTIKESAVSGRYISLKHIEPFLLKLPKELFEVSVLGESVLHQPIYHLKVGNGPIKILMWSQMHGNESTTTKALLDLCNHIIEDKSVLDGLTLSIIPILNPDGANAYTRINANKVDLNRDSQLITQPESKVFKAHYDNFKPHICLNLHGQRTIFSAGATNKPATLSFLAPAGDEKRLVNDTRKQSMRLISALNSQLQTIIPNQVGRYDDGFNANCIGDALTMLNIPTILFEAGHYNNDYDREEVRYLVYRALLTTLKEINKGTHSNGNHENYEQIPENDKLFCDIIIKDALIDDELLDIELQYEEKLINGVIKFESVVKNISSKSEIYAHRYIDANRKAVFDENFKSIAVNNRLMYITMGEVKILLNKD